MAVSEGICDVGGRWQYGRLPLSLVYRVSVNFSWLLLSIVFSDRGKRLHGKIHFCNNIFLLTYVE